MTGANLHGAMNERDRLRELAAITGSGQAVLFTGAGFSTGAKDRSGAGIPDSRQMVRDLWEMLFGLEPPDDSSLADLYDVALARTPDKLRDYLTSRLRVGDSPLSGRFAAWFAAPWRRIYTLNIDDLEVAVERQFRLPRHLASVSAIAPGTPRVEPGCLEVVHLNGIAGEDPWHVTFSTMQYAARLCAPDHGYERLIDDLRTAPFVFVGTTLDEVVLWKHVELDRQQNGVRARPHSFLISPSLSRARQALLASHRIHWIAGTAEEIADRVLR
jgi:hypothetical protein